MMIGVLFRSGSHDVHLFWLTWHSLNVHKGYHSCCSWRGSDLLYSRWSYIWSYSLIQFCHAPPVTMDSVPVWCAVWRATCHFGDLWGAYTLQPCVFSMTEEGCETWWRHSLTACWLKDRIMGGWVMQAEVSSSRKVVESSQHWETMGDKLTDSLWENQKPRADVHLLVNTLHCWKRHTNNMFKSRLTFTVLHLFKHSWLQMSSPGAELLMTHPLFIFLGLGHIWS